MERGLKTFLYCIIQNPSLEPRFKHYVTLNALPLGKLTGNSSFYMNREVIANNSQSKNSQYNDFLL